jgi:hypothetical protein
MSKYHILKPGDEGMYHLRLGCTGTVQHVSVRRGKVLLRFKDGTEGSYPVEALRVRNPADGYLTLPCRVE